jgi:hypothetical protein
VALSDIEQPVGCDAIEGKVASFEADYQSIIREAADRLNFNEPDPNSLVELDAFKLEAEQALAGLQDRYPTLAGKRLGGVGKLYLYDPTKYNERLEREVLMHWLTVPESLELKAGQVAILASGWYERPVTVDRFKRRFKDPKLSQTLQRLCYEHGNPTQISTCRSLPGIQQRLRLHARQTADKWSFKGEITFYENGDVSINNKLVPQDVSNSGKKRVRGNRVAITIDVLRAFLSTYT